MVGLLERECSSRGDWESCVVLCGWSECSPEQVCKKNGCSVFQNLCGLTCNSMQVVDCGFRGTHFLYITLKLRGRVSAPAKAVLVHKIQIAFLSTLLANTRLMQAGRLLGGWHLFISLAPLMRNLFEVFLFCIVFVVVVIIVIAGIIVIITTISTIIVMNYCCYYCNYWYFDFYYFHHHRHHHMTSAAFFYTLLCVRVRIMQASTSPQHLFSKTNCRLLCFALIICSRKQNAGYQLPTQYVAHEHKLQAAVFTICVHVHITQASNSLHMISVLEHKLQASLEEFAVQLRVKCVKTTKRISAIQCTRAPKIV